MVANSAPPPSRWPLDTLEWGSLTATGWRPTPLRQFVLKVHQRCNLSCDYCYVYTMADQTWKTRPAVMPPDVREATVRRIAEHAAHHELADVTVVLHGGEPLLAGAATLAALAGAIRAALPRGTTAHLSIQTNGTLLGPRVLETLAAAAIRVGVSLDGTDSTNDAHRVYADGRGSAARIRAGIGLLRQDQFRHLYAGLLCTVDLAADPIATYEALLEHRPPVVDFLLPHANWTTKAWPPGAYGRWLSILFERWYAAPVQETRIPLFEAALALLLGGASRSEYLGTSPHAAIVVESDGAIEQTDALKSAYPSAAETGLSVLHNGFDEALRHPGVMARQLGPAGLAASCLDCELVRVCGGGHYAHRYHPERGFLGPSAYCQDMKVFLAFAAGRVGADLRARLERVSPALAAGPTVASAAGPTVASAAGPALAPAAGPAVAPAVSRARG